MRDRISFNVDNSQNFAPTDGADLIINPKLRSNTETHPDTIINTVSGENVPATFENLVLLVMVGLKTIMGSNVCVFLVEET